MHILSIGNFGRGWDGSICDEEHIASMLKELGHSVKIGHRKMWAGFLTQLEVGSTTANIINDMNTKDTRKIDFVLLAQWDGAHPNLVSYLKQIYNCPVIYWAFDYQADGQEWHERLIRESDLYLSKRLADSKYSNWQWLPQDFAPSFLDKKESGIKDIDVLFTGSYLDWATERNETIKAVGEKFNLVIHSVNAWPEEFGEIRTPIMDEDLPELYARAKIVLSIDHTLEAGYWSDRNAQIMACGGFVLCRYVPMMETVFRENIAYFYSIEDCLEKLGNLLRPDITPIREEYAQRGYEYAQKNLMVRNRVNDLLTIVGSIL